MEYIFFGRLLPERIPLKVDPPIRYSLAYDGLALKYEAELIVADSQFIVNFDLTEGQSDLHTLRNLVLADVLSVADIAGWMNGLAFDAEVISCARAGHGIMIFGNGNGALRRSNSTNVLDGNTLMLGLINDDVRRIMRDVRYAIRDARDAAFYSYRAIETMMQSVRQANETDARAWDRLRDSLNVSRETLNKIKSHSDYPRHGRANTIFDEQRTSIMRMLDEIVRRYISFVRVGFVALDRSAFPTYEGENVP